MTSVDTLSQEFKKVNQSDALFHAFNKKHIWDLGTRIYMIKKPVLVEKLSGEKTEEVIISLHRDGIITLESGFIPRKDISPDKPFSEGSTSGQYRKLGKEGKLYGLSPISNSGEDFKCSFPSIIFKLFKESDLSVKDSVRAHLSLDGTFQISDEYIWYIPKDVALSMANIRFTDPLSEESGIFNKDSALPSTEHKDFLYLTYYGRVPTVGSKLLSSYIGVSSSLIFNDIETTKSKLDLKHGYDLLTELKVRFERYSSAPQRKNASLKNSDLWTQVSIDKINSAVIIPEKTDPSVDPSSTTDPNLTTDPSSTTTDPTSIPDPNSITDPSLTTDPSSTTTDPTSIPDPNSITDPSLTPKPSTVIWDNGYKNSLTKGDITKLRNRYYYKENQKRTENIHNYIKELNLAQERKRRLIKLKNETRHDSDEREQTVYLIKETNESIKKLENLIVETFESLKHSTE
jgi:hypothetical protein